MKLKTLLFSLSALILFAACNSNGTTENASIQMPTNIVFNSTEVMSNNNEIVETKENNDSKWLKYGSHRIWTNYNSYFMEYEMYNKLSLKEPDLLDIMVYCYEYSISLDYRIYGILLGDNGQMLLDIKAPITAFGYPFKFAYYTDENLSNRVEISYKRALEKYTEQLELMMKIDANDIPETEKCYGGFRERNGKIEFVINRVNNNKIVAEYVYFASKNDLITEFFAGTYIYKDANTKKESILKLNEQGNVLENLAYSDFMFVTYTTPSNDQKPGILLIKCDSDLPNDECIFVDINLVTLGALEYNHKNSTLSVYEVNNKENCYDYNVFNETAYDIQSRFLYRVNCGQTTKGKLLFTLKRSK